jgi:hypothetical protein
MRPVSKRRHRLCAVVGSLVIAGATSAAPAVSESSTEGAQVPDWLESVPQACRGYAEVPAYSPDVFAWNQLLSLAACMQQPTLAHVSDPEQLGDMVDELFAGVAPSLLIYLDAIAHGPGPVQLRAAYHVALAHVALVTRARQSIVISADTPPSRASARRYRELQRRLEPLLESAMQTARISLSVIDRAAASDPTLAPDAVTKNMVASARMMLAHWPAPPDQPESQLTQLPGAAAAPGPASRPPS